MSRMVPADRAEGRCWPFARRLVVCVLGEELLIRLDRIAWSSLIQNRNLFIMFVVKDRLRGLVDILVTETL